MAVSDSQALLLTVSADTSKALKAIDQLNQKLSGVAPQMERNAKKAAEGIERSFGNINVDRALSRVFDRTKFTTIEAGAAKIPILGAAIEELGVVGIGAAAGLAAAAVAAEQARKAMEWADTLEKTAQGLGVTTDSLQKLDYAAVASSIGVEKGREALGEFNALIGKFETNTAAGRINKWATAIHLSRDEVNATIDPIAKLQLVLQRISTLRDAQSRAAAAKAFGLDGFLPLIQQGTPAIQAFINKMKEAQDVGGVIGADDIKRAAELNDQVEALTYLIGQHFKQAFIDAAPAIEKVAEFIETCSRVLADFVQSIPDAVRGLKELLSITGGDGQGPSFSDQLRATASGLGLDPLIQAYDALKQRGQEARERYNDPDDPDVIRAQHRQFLAEQARQQSGQQLTFDKTKKAKAGPRDDTAERADAVAAALAQADQKRLQALGALTDDLLKRAEFEKQALTAETAQENARLDKEIDRIEADKGMDDGKKRQLVAQLELAKIENQKTEVSKADLIDRTAIAAVADRQIEIVSDIVHAQLDQLQAEADIATTAQQRRAIEERILAIRQKLEKDVSDIKLERDTKFKGDTPDARYDEKREKAALDTKQAAERQQFSLANETPVQKYLRSIQDLNTVFEDASVTAVKNLSDGLAEAIVNAQDLGDVAKNVFRQLVAQLLSAALQKDIFGPVLGFLGLASGGYVSGPGSSTSDSIPARLSDGEFVVKASATAKHRKLLEAINAGAGRGFADGGYVTPSLAMPHLESLRAMSLPSFAARAGDVILNVNVDAGGAIPREEIVSMVRQGSLQAVSAARGLAAGDARRSMPAAIRRQQLLGTP